MCPLDGQARVLLDASPNAVVGVDDTGTIRYVNSRAEQLFAYSADDLLGVPVEALLDPAQSERHSTHRREFMAAPAPRPMGGDLALSARRSDGTIIPVEISLTPVEVGSTVWVFAAVADIRSRRATDARMAVLTRVYQTLAETNQAIVRARDEQTLFDEACRIAVGSGGYLGAFVGRAGADGTVESVASAGALDEYVAGLALTVDPDSARGWGPTARALRDGQFYYSADFATDPVTGPWRERAAAYGIRASATLPLRCGGSTVAALTLYSDVADIFDEQMRTLLEGMASNISFALDGFRTDAELRRVVAQRGALLARLVEAQEDERAKIAADVHDDSVQALSAVDLRLGSLQRRLADHVPELTEALAQSQRAVAAANDRLRALLFDLEPVSPGLALTDALRDVAAYLFEATPRWSVTGDGDLPAVEKQQAVRVAKEALNNVRSHARASFVRITVHAVTGGVEIAIADDGVGLDPHAVRSAPGHRGLASMRDRAEIAGGWLRLERGEPTGTVVRFWIPGGPGAGSAAGPAVEP